MRLDLCRTSELLNCSPMAKQQYKIFKQFKLGVHSDAKLEEVAKACQKPNNVKHSHWSDYQSYLNFHKSKKS